MGICNQTISLSPCSGGALRKKCIPNCAPSSFETELVELFDYLVDGVTR